MNKVKSQKSKVKSNRLPQSTLNTLKFFTSVFSVLSVVILLSFINCQKSGQGKVIAKVNGDVITETEFTKALPKGFTSDSIEKNYRHSLIDRMIVKRLIIQDAKRLNIDKEVDGIFENDKKTILIQALYDDVVTKNVKISRQEIENAQKLLLTEVHIKQITVPDENMAQMVSDELKKGVSFDTVAKNFSKDPSGQIGGDMGFVPALYLEKAVRENVMKMKPGEISSPIHCAEDFKIVNFLEKRMSSDSNPNLKDNARQFIEQDKSRTLAQNYLKKLDQRLEYNPAGLNVFNKSYDSITAQDGEIWVVKKDKKKVVYAKNLLHVAREFPNLLDTAMRSYAVKRAVEEDVLYEDAIDRNLEKKPEARIQLDQRKDDLLYERYFLTQITQKTEISDKEIEDYYNANKVQFGKSKLTEVAQNIRQQILPSKRQLVYQQVAENLKSQAKIEINEQLVMSSGKIKK